MKIVIGIAAVAFVLIVGILGLAAMKPDIMFVSRTAVIDASPEVVYGYLADLREWEKWSPWDERDPDLIRTYSGAASGLGAVYEWAGNRDVGKGRMTITYAAVPSRVNIQLDFIEPFASTFETQFGVLPEGEGSLVTWTMHGENSFVSKLMSVFMDMEGMIGQDFERGLDKLRHVIGTESAALPVGEAEGA
jgi:hypothetical protein